MSKMSQKQAEKVGKKVSRVVLNTKSVTFRCKSNSDGKTVRDIIQNAFKPDNVTRYNYDLEGFLTFGMSEWKEFRAKFRSPSDAEDCYNEVDATVTAFQSSGDFDEDVSGGGSGGGSGNHNTSDFNPEVSDDDKSNTTTYIIIGAAAAIIILLLLWKPKGK